MRTGHSTACSAGASLPSCELRFLSELNNHGSIWHRGRTSSAIHLKRTSLRCSHLEKTLGGCHNSPVKSDYGREWLVAVEVMKNCWNSEEKRALG